MHDVAELDEGVWRPRPGERVTVDYPDGWSPSMPKRRVGTVLMNQTALPAGSFTLLIQPQQHRVVIVPAECVAAGVTYRKWVQRDGWPTSLPESGKKRLKRGA